MRFGLTTRRSRRRTLVGLVAAMMIVGAAVVIQQVAATAGGGGDSALERWIAGQIKGLVASQLKPEVRFTTFDYRAPTTVILTDVELVDHVNGDRTFIAAKKLTLELAELPRENRPIVIERIRFDRPVVRVLTDETTGEIVGFDRMLRDDEVPDASDDGEPVNVNDVFRVRLIQIVGGAVEYADGGGGRPMRLDDIHTELKIGDPEDGWYGVALKAGHPPFSDIAVEGRLNIDAMALDLAPARIDLDLAPENLGVLPDSARSLIERYGLRGRMKSQLTGRLDLGDPGRSALDLEADLHGGMIDFGQYVLPLESMKLSASIADGLLSLRGLSAETLGGRVDARGQLSLDGSRRAQLDVNIDGVRLERAIDPEGLTEGQPPRFAGRVDAQVAVDSPAASADSPAIGRGRVTVADGWLINIPVVSGLSRQTLKDSHHQHPHEELHDGLPPHGFGRWHEHNGDGIDQIKTVKMNDTAEIEFDIEPDLLRFTSITAKGPNVGVRGKGTLDYTGLINLRLRGGPLEKFDWLGNVSPIHYHVFGPVDDPKVQPTVGSIDRKLDGDENPIAQPLKDGVDTIIEGVESVIPDQIKPE